MAASATPPAAGSGTATPPAEAGIAGKINPIIIIAFIALILVLVIAFFSCQGKRSNNKLPENAPVTNSRDAKYAAEVQPELVSDWQKCRLEKINYAYNLVLVHNRWIVDIKTDGPVILMTEHGIEATSEFGPTPPNAWECTMHYGIKPSGSTLHIIATKKPTTIYWRVNNLEWKINRGIRKFFEEK